MKDFIEYKMETFPKQILYKAEIRIGSTNMININKSIIMD